MQTFGLRLIVYISFCYLSERAKALNRQDTENAKLSEKADFSLLLLPLLKPNFCAAAAKALLSISAKILNRQDTKNAKLKMKNADGELVLRILQILQVATDAFLFANSVIWLRVFLSGGGRE